MIPKRWFEKIIFPLLIAVFLLSGCLTAPGEPAAAQDAEGTAVPTPTRDPSGYQAVPAQSCLVGDWAAMQSDKAQGDLLTWQPGTSNLAYMAPAERSSWYIGDLMFAQGPDFQQKVALAPNVQASGDLTWSPDGSLLAFLVYRPNEGLYTVMVVRPDGSGLTDLFPTDLARTDARSSQKAILGWQGEDILVVISSCGEECRLAFAIQVNSAPGAVLAPTPLSNYHELAANLEMHRNVQDFDAKQFPKALSDETSNPMPNWSPDQRTIAFLDRRGLLWLLLIKDKIHYMLDIGLRDVYETQWADGSDFIAIRAEDRIFIFQVPCGKKP